MGDGLLGLLLYLGSWLSPEAERASLDTRFDRFINNQNVSFTCQMDIAWNRRLEQLVDAGIPLRFKIISFTDKSDTSLFYRSLYFDVVKYTYTFIDSSELKVTKSDSYPLVHLVLRDFCRWKMEIPEDASSCRIEVQILPSRAEQLNRVVDMSRIWGRQKVYLRFDPQEKIRRKPNKRK